MDQQHDTDDIDSGVSAEAFIDPVLEAYRTQDEQLHWQDELIASRKERQVFNKRGIDTIKRYADEREVSSSVSHFNVFFMNTETKLSNLYARTPKPDISRRFKDADDQPSRIAANILERNISYELESEGFDPKFKQMLWDRLVPGVGLGWARLDQEEGEPDYDHMGMAVPGSHIKAQLADIDYVGWDDFLWAPCRVWSDCRWVARRVPMSKEAVKQRFAQTADPMVLMNLTFNKLSSMAPVDGNQSMQPKYTTQSTVDVYEIWDKERALIFWVVEAADSPLDIQKDSNEFPGFFPTPLPPMSRTTTSSTTPISDFSLVQDLYNELDSLNNRCSKLVKALQLKFVYDAANPALRDLYTSASELEGVGVKDWAIQVNEKGGIQGAMEFVPLQMIAETYQKLVQARDMVKAQIFEIEGISDFQRGVMQPYVTNGQAQATSAASASRLTVMQNEVADYVQRLLRLKAHLICKFYTPQTLMQRCGQFSPTDMQFVQPALQLLSNEQMNHWRLEVSVESIQQDNWNQDKQEMGEMLHSVAAFLAQLMPMAQQMPQIVPASVEVIKMYVTKFKGSKAVEGALDAMLDSMTQAAAQKQQTPPQPTTEQLRLQGKQMQLQAQQQIAQASDQKDMQIAQMQAQIKVQELQIKAAEASTRAKEVDHQIMSDKSNQLIDIVSKAHDHAMDRITPVGGA